MGSWLGGEPGRGRGLKLGPLAGARAGVEVEAERGWVVLPPNPCGGWPGPHCTPGTFLHAPVKGHDSQLGTAAVC